MSDRIIVGLTEDVILYGAKKDTVKARIDSGATRSSMDLKLAEELHLGPIIRRKKVKSAHGSMLRPIIECEIEIKNKKMKVEFTLADREHMKYRVLIGQNVLKEQQFLIDPLLE